MQQKSSARFTVFCILLLVIWYIFDTPNDWNFDWNTEDFELFSETGITLGGLAIAGLVLLFALFMAALVIAGVSFLLVGIFVLFGALFLMIFSPFLLPVLLIVVVLSIFKRKSR
ncbi:hypothetical protein [Undibacterium sp. TJN19]|uniref:hypothetical protein n=1 Tax=Undibacterium sp. TJN19 TaxID=3413055 RepID=UPI003BF15715